MTSNSDKLQQSSMHKELRSSKPIYFPSQFWEELNSKHTDQLIHYGFKNFKRTVNMKYFNWGTLGIIRQQLNIVLSQLFQGNLKPLYLSRFRNYNNTKAGNIKHFNAISAFIYRIFVASYADYLKATDIKEIFNIASEPKIGNPFIVEYKNQLLSQDLCNSIHEFYSITNKIAGQSKMNIAEIGAGYGRLATVFLKVLPQCTYTIIDIPPALHVSQKYISAVFPNDRIFFFHSFKSFNQIKKEFISARIRFILPHQLEYLPKKYYNLMINISSFHEMTREQIKNFVSLIDRLTHGFFYLKQWRKSRTSVNSYIKEFDYQFPKNWRLIYRRSPHPIQKMFFDALYKI